MISNFKFEYNPALPHLKTPLPGSNAKQLVDRDHQLLSPSYTRDYPLTVKRGFGMGIEDLDGNWFLDFTAGIAVMLIRKAQVDISARCFAEFTPSASARGLNMTENPRHPEAEPKDLGWPAALFG